MTLEELFEKLSTMPGDTYIVRIAAWYDFEPKPHQGELFNEILTWDGSDYIWDNDWYEGQQNINILGFISLQDVNVPCMEVNEDAQKDR